MPMTDLRLASSSDLPAPGARVHLVGVAGAGMRALARVLGARGFQVSGADRDRDAAAALEASGIHVVAETDEAAVRESALVVYSSALPADHPALGAARRAGVPTMKRARALGALVNDRRLLAVAGTHGKTTITAMLGLALERAGLDPLVLAGGRVSAWAGNARVGKGELAVVEADEYDRSFLELAPDVAIVTSVEPEHLDVYGDAAAMRAAYAEFAGRAGRVLVCADDAGASELGAALPRPDEVRSYGYAEEADWRLEVLEAGRSGQSCRLHEAEGSFAFRVGIPGAHNAQNAAAALAAARWLDVPPASLATALEDFRGAERRLQVLYESRDLVIVDDYAHHPTEIRAGVEALRSGWPGRRLVLVFQPHLYTRTRDLAPEFSDALAAADRGFVLPIYPSREAPIPGVTRDLILAAGRRGLEGLAAADVERLLAVDEPTVLAFMGAGDVTSLAHRAARAAAGGGSDALGG